MKFSIITAYYKNEELTKEFLDNLKGRLPVNREVIVVNAGSEPIYHELITTRIDLSENKGFSNSMNKGIQQATGDILCIIGNDVFPESPVWLEELGVSMLNTNATLICPDNTNPGLKAYKHVILNEYGDRYTEVKMFPAICYVIRREDFLRIGYFDERFLVGTYEDDDFCRRLKLMNGKIMVDKFVVVKHLLSKTMNLFNVGEVMSKNMDLYLKKWGERK